MEGYEPDAKVVDLARMLTSSQRAEIERAISVLEGDTPFRFRVLAPPPGLGPENKKDWPSVVRAVKNYWAKDPRWDNENAVVLLANPRVQSGRPGNPVSWSVASKLTERLQFRLASDTFTKIGNKFGTASYMADAGEAGAVVACSLNAIACLRKGVCVQPLPENEVAALVAGEAPVLTDSEKGAIAASNARWNSRK